LSDPASQAQELCRQYQGAEPAAVLAGTMERFPEAAMGCSLGLEDVALVHMASQLPRPPRIFVLDTGRLPPQTYDVLAALRARYGLPIEIYFPAYQTVEAYVNQFGPNAFRESLELRKACCRMRKVEPLARALRGATAWITGLRRAQGPTRAAMSAFETDGDHGGIVKVNPLLDWSLDDAWAFVRTHGLPYNPLHDAGYPSIGCAPCTRAVAPGEDERAGRWWWERAEHKECGLHRTHS
jgi:phosphoadenosine phosphosulfate reductase